MGYYSTLEGELRIVHTLRFEQMIELKPMLEEDCRRHPEWRPGDVCYINLELADSMDRLTPPEDRIKAYDFPECINVLIRHMRTKWPEFALEGRIDEQGEDPDDRRYYEIGADGFAHEVENPPNRGRCPNCKQVVEVEAV